MFFVRLLLTVIAFAPIGANCEENVFLMSPTERAYEESRESSRQILRELRYFHSGFLNFRKLSQQTAVPMNIIQAESELSGLDHDEHDKHIMDFAEGVGRYMARGLTVKDSVHRYFSDNPERAKLVLERAVAIYKAH